MATAQDSITDMFVMPPLPDTVSVRSVSTCTRSTDLDSQVIPHHDFSIETWKGNNEQKRYLLDDLIQPVKKGRKIEEELTHMNINDCRYWAIRYLERKEYNPNQTSPDIAEKERAARWLKSFRTQLTKVFVEECRYEYFRQSNDLKTWSQISGGQGFQSYADLERGTKGMTTELVSDKVE